MSLRKRPPLSRQATQRSILTGVALGLGGLLILSCETGLESRTGIGQFAVAPVFQSDAAGIVPVASVRIILTRSDSTTLALDTLITISEGQDTVDVSLSVLVLGASETFFLELQLMDPAGEVVFSSGPTVVTATTSGVEPEPTPVVVVYVGVGADAAAVEITTTDTTVLFGETVTLEGVALDSDGEVIEGTPIRWSSTDAARAMFPDPGTGALVGGSVRGPVSVIAELLTGPSDTASVLVQPLPTLMVAVSGDGQAGEVGTELREPLVVRVTADDELGVQGTPVQYSLEQDGLLSDDVVLTDADGLAQVTWTVGSLVGEQRVAAVVSGFADLAVTFTAMTGVSAELVADGIASLEDALFTAVTTYDAGPADDLATLDLFSFGPAKDLFRQALDLDPDNETAAFGLAVTTLLSLEDDPSLRAAADDWDLWLANHIDAEELFTDLADFPPTLAEQQDLLRTIVQPAVLEALDAANTIDSPDFTFTITTRMQGDLPGIAGPRELDLTEILGFRAGLEAALAGIDVALAYQTTPSPYSVSGFDAALAPTSTFGTLAADGSTLLTDAHARLQTAVSLAQQGLDFLEGETDDQSNDVIKYNPAAPPVSDYDFDLFIGPADVQDARDVFADIEGALAGPYTITEDLGRGVVDLVVNATQFFMTIPDLKALLPEYQTGGGDFHWTALAFDEWLFPDPTFAGILPNILSSDELKQKIDLGDAYDDARLNLDEWVALAPSAADDAVFAITQFGNLREMSVDFSSDTDRPDVPVTGFFIDHVVALAPMDISGPELLAITWDGRVFSRPDDDGSPWTLRLTLLVGCCWSGITVTPVGGRIFAITEFGDLFQIASDFSASFAGPGLFYFITALTSGTSQLVALSYDGLVFAIDAVTPWTQVFALPFDFDVEDNWVGLTRSPVDNDFFAITESGDLIEISIDSPPSTASVTDRPDVPATRIVSLTINDDTGELLAVTEDGRVFSRPDDAGTPWTLRRTLPRTILP